MPRVWIAAVIIAMSWIWMLVFRRLKRTDAEGVREQSDEERWSKRKMETTK
jgi:hypothetical protein